MNNDFLSHFLRTCNETQLISLIKQNIIGIITYENVLSLMDNPNFDIYYLIINQIGHIPFNQRNSKFSNQIQKIFQLLREYNPSLILTALAEFINDNPAADYIDSIIWGKFGEDDFSYLLSLSEFNFVENILDAMNFYYDDLGYLINFYEWYSYSKFSHIFLSKIKYYLPNELSLKINYVLKSSDEPEISDLISLNLLHFTDPESIRSLLNSPECTLLENFVNIFKIFDKQGLYDNFELCENLIYKLGENMSNILKNKLTDILKRGNIDDLKMILQFRWLEHLSPDEFKSITTNSKINLLNNLKKIIFNEILDELNYHRGRIIKYIPRVLLNIIQSIDSELLEKIILIDELHEQNREDLIWLLTSNLDSQDFQQKEDVNRIVRMLNKN